MMMNVPRAITIAQSLPHYACTVAEGEKTVEQLNI
jgi:hypothetical protein